MAIDVCSRMPIMVWQARTVWTESGTRDSEGEIEFNKEAVFTGACRHRWRRVINTGTVQFTKRKQLVPKTITRG